MAGRRLTAILAADIAGYSALMGENDLETVADLKGHQSATLPLIAGYSGRVIDTAGDGILAEFPSVFNAVKCAVAIQEVMLERNASVPPERRMQFRIGINQGDVLFDEQRIYGDGINIAARLEGLCEPGSICISSKVYEEIKGRFEIQYEDIGERTLRNIATPVRVYRINLSAISPRGRVSSLKFVEARGLHRWVIAVAGLMLVSSSVAWWVLKPRIPSALPAAPTAIISVPDPIKSPPASAPALAIQMEGAGRAPLICTSWQVEVGGACVTKTPNEGKIRALAEKQKIPLPARILFTPPSATTPAKFAAYFGGWGGDERWNGVGRHIVLVVTRVDSSGEAYGFFAQGPPNSQTANQNPAVYAPFKGSVNPDELKFVLWGNTAYRFFMAPDGRMTGQVHWPAGAASIKIEHIE
jgi:class 3 adenylate cyclase